MMQDLILAQSNVQWVLAELWLTSLNPLSPFPLLTPFCLFSCWMSDWFIYQCVWTFVFMWLHVHVYTLICIFSDYATVSDIRVRSISYMTEIHKSVAPPKNCPRMYSELQFCTFLSFHQWPLLILSWQNFICWWKHLVSVYIWAEQIQKYQFWLKQKTAPESTLKYSSVHVSLLKNDPCWSSTNRTSSTDGNILYWKS